MTLITRTRALSALNALRHQCTRRRRARVLHLLLLPLPLLLLILQRVLIRMWGWLRMWRLRVRVGLSRRMWMRVGLR